MKACKVSTVTFCGDLLGFWEIPKIGNSVMLRAILAPWILCGVLEFLYIPWDLTVKSSYILSIIDSAEFSAILDQIISHVSSIPWDSIL